MFSGACVHATPIYIQVHISCVLFVCLDVVYVCLNFVVFGRVGVKFCLYMYILNVASGVYVCVFFLSV